MSEEVIEYITDAILFVAEEGMKFLPFYTFYPDTGEWYFVFGDLIIFTKGQFKTKEISSQNLARKYDVSTRQSNI